MKVKELIQKLQECDPELTVCGEYEWENFTFTGVRESHWETFIGEEDPWFNRKILVID